MCGSIEMLAVQGKDERSCIDKNAEFVALLQSQYGSMNFAWKEKPPGSMEEFLRVGSEHAHL